MKSNRKVAALRICICLLLAAFLQMKAEIIYGGQHRYEAEELYDAAMGIVDWAASGTTEGLFCESFCEGAGNPGNDWLAIGYCRLLPGEDASDYLQSLRGHVEEMYMAGNLENQKATEWHRISLAVLAAGGNPTAFGTAQNGSAIDLIADGTYDRAKYSSLGRQGVNGWCFALIALDGAGAVVPESAAYDREDMILQILSSQLENGSFPLAKGSIPDVDVTAMAVQALAPYRSVQKSYSFEQNGEIFTRTPSEAINSALSWLSQVQLENGDFSSYGIANAESTAQVLMALTSLGIDPQQDQRFIRNGNTVLDGLMRFQMDDGGFAHVLNSDSAENKSNGLASAQSLCALAAVYRQMKGMSSFYSFLSENDNHSETTWHADEGKAQENAGRLEASGETENAEQSYTTEKQETLSAALETEPGMSVYAAYIFAGIAGVLGILSYLVMKHIGKE